MADTTKVNMERLRSLFSGEGSSLLTTLNHLITRLIENNYDREDLDQAFRAAHSLKSEAAFLGYSLIEKASHDLEDQLQTLREEKTTTGKENLEQLLSTFGRLEEAFTKTVEEQNIEESEEENTFRVSSFDNFSDFERTLLIEAKNRGEHLYEVHCKVDLSESMPYPRAYLLVNKLEMNYNVLRCVPSLEELKKKTFREFKVYLSSFEAENEIRKAADIELIEVIGITRVDYPENLSEMDISSKKIKQEPIEEKTVELSAKNFDELSFFVNEVKEYAKYLKVKIDSSEQGNEATLREQLRLCAEQLSAMGGEMEAALYGSIENPLSHLFPKLERLVDKLSTEQGKEVSFIKKGGQLCLAAPLVEELSTILVHLLRNSIDHGIENPDTRKANGKPARGRITLTISKDEDNLLVSVADDGKGISFAEAVNTAKEKGLITQSRDLLSIISQPGYSSREAATEVSGRGVGLDVVRHRIESVLRGSLKLETEPGKGSRIIIELNTKIRLIKVLIFRCGAEHFAMPQAIFVKALSPGKAVLHRRDEGLLKLDEEEIPVLQFSRDESQDESDKIWIILSHLGKHVAVPADELVSEEIVVWEESAKNRVFSKTINRELDYINPFAPQ